MPKLIERFISPSTLEFFRQARQQPGYSLGDSLHGYLYGRWTHLYISLGTGRHPLMKKLKPALRWFNRQMQAKRPEAPADGQPAQPHKRKPQFDFSETYHGKVLPLAAARQLVTVREDVRLPNLEKIIPYQRARDIVLQNPDHIAVIQCPCRSAKANPCLPLDVCLVVGEPFASFVIEHQPGKARWVSQQEAEAILQAEDERGHVHHAFFKDAMLDRFYAICNCCECCCGAMHAHHHGTPMLAASGYLAQVDEDTCIACEACTEYCQFGALGLGDLYMTIDKEKCMGCGVCVNHCHQGALSLQREASKGEPLEIVALMDAAQRN